MLVTTDWLARHLDDPDVEVVDMRWREDGSGRTLYEGGHVPGAVFLDWATDLVDPDHSIAFMLAPPERFARAMARCGIGDDTVVVAYSDRLGSGPHRLWWGCLVYGHEQVRVLDGGLEKWVAEGRPVETGSTRPGPATWRPRPGPPLLASAEDVGEGASRSDVVVLDSRPPEQFRGHEVWFESGPVAADEDGIARTPRGPIRAGRVPWAANVPAGELYRPDGTMKPPDELRKLFDRVGVGPGSRVVAHCGVGVSAAALVFGLRLAEVDAVLYDASWEEWGRDPTHPVARDAPSEGLAPLGEE